MRYFVMIVFLLSLTLRSFAQVPAQGPSDKKAQKTYQQGLESLQQHDAGVSLWYFQKADKEDGGKCLTCQEQMIQLGLSTSNWKVVENGASELALEIQE
ncbi:MAG TPA: hypothetical protein VGF44_10855, partial [Terriglobales bacterium]